jgi:hypothetical protein
VNNQKRTFNPLLGKQFRYEQAEDLSLKYSGNWGAAQQQPLSNSEWVVENGDAVLSGASFVTSGSGTTSVLISGSTGENTITNTVTFADGQVDSRIIKLKITDNSDPNINYDYGLGKC